VAVARDNDGFTNGSAPVTMIIDPPGGNPTVASITSLVDGTTISACIGRDKRDLTTGYPDFTDGKKTSLPLSE